MIDNENENVNTDAQIPPVEEAPRQPRPIDTLGARLDGAEALADWARQTAVGAGLLAMLCLAAVLFLAWRLRGAMGFSGGVAAAGLA
jgi:hypothetical protein